jgi:hypothetical protein
MEAVAVGASILQQIGEVLPSKWEDQQALVKILAWEECLEKVRFRMMEEECLLQVFKEANLKDKIQDKAHLKMF